MDFKTLPAVLNPGSGLLNKFKRALYKLEQTP